jgi:hypothetical protein
MQGTYPAFSKTNLITWNFFSQATAVSFKTNFWGSSLFQRFYLLRISFAVSIIGTGLVTTLLALIPNSPGIDLILSPFAAISPTLLKYIRFSYQPGG